MDITELILAQHHEQRRAFALLDEVPRDDTETLDAVWTRLSIFLEVHAEAEERFFYPALLRIGEGPPGKDDDGPAEETEDAVKDHNEIRQAIKKSQQHPAGSDEWWAAVYEARVANSDHMAEEEREDLADFRQHADLQTRHDIGLRFIAFENAHADGVPLHEPDPEQYVAENSRAAD
jgi:hypothetical protein